MRLISTVPSDHFLFENFQFCFVLDAFLWLDFILEIIF
jgi:hypothetical protein